MIAANNGHLLAFDNLSGLPFWLSDAFCRLASGGSFAVRQLYTDDEEVLFQAARPLLLNGIEDVVNRPDLADRAIFLNLPPIGQAQRRPEAELWREFEIARPRLLGALLDAVAHGLRSLTDADCRPRGLPRMADFAHWIPPVKPRSGSQVHLRTPMRRTAALRSSASLMAIRSRAGSVTSWPDRKSGPAQLVNSFVLA
jgi:hypothetical protein